MRLDIYLAWGCDYHLGTWTVSVIPYSWQLRRISLNLEQLQMGNNGSYTGLRGNAGLQIGWTIRVVPGTDGNYSFHQMAHRGTTLVPHTSIRFCRPLRPVLDQHNVRVATVFAHAEASTLQKTAGKLTEESRPTKGSCPINMILADAAPLSVSTPSRVRRGRVCSRAA